ncbi:MAG: STAS domain-containing protein [Magnetospirillum sp.]|nr:STAS domain-containing protein [Magnetospirillum sp.]
MQYTIRDQGGRTELSIAGRLTFAEAAAFPKVLAELDKVGKERLDIQLRDLTFIDSTGMSLFVHVYDSANAAGTEVVIKGAAGSVRAALGRAAFETLFKFE